MLLLVMIVPAVVDARQRGQLCHKLDDNNDRTLYCKVLEQLVEFTNS